MTSMGDLEVYSLADEHRTECVDCDDTCTITAIIKHAESFAGLPESKPADESNWTPSREGWLCPDCDEQRQREEELNKQPEKTVDEPPSEWRFCQECGDQLDPSRREGQYCESCAD